MQPLPNRFEEVAVARRLGRRVPALSRAAIVAAGLEIGLDELSLAEVAKHLDVTPAALYRHVKGYDDLISAVGDHLMGGFAPPPDTGQMWWDYLRELGLSVRAFVHRHPGLGLHLMRIRDSSIETLRLIERCDTVLVARGLAPLDAMALAGTVASFAVGIAETERLAAQAAVDSRRHALFYDGVSRYAEELPVLNAASAARLAPTDPDVYFAWQLICLIDGIVRSHEQGTLPWRSGPFATFTAGGE